MPLQEATWRDFGERLFERHNIYEGVGFENHCRRLSAIVDLLLEHHRSDFPRGLSHALCMGHDLGLICREEEGVDYMHRSLSLFEREAHDELGVRLEGELSDTARECLLFNHRLSAVPNAKPESELFRQAVWIEHTRGVRRYGLPRAPIRELFERFPRANLDAVLFDFARRTVRHEPRSIVDGIFF